LFETIQKGHDNIDSLKGKLEEAKEQKNILENGVSHSHVEEEKKIVEPPEKKSEPAKIETPKKEENPQEARLSEKKPDSEKIETPKKEEKKPEDIPQEVVGRVSGKKPEDTEHPDVGRTSGKKPEPETNEVKLNEVKTEKADDEFDPNEA